MKFSLVIEWHSARGGPPRTLRLPPPRGWLRELFATVEKPGAVTAGSDPVDAPVVAALHRGVRDRIGRNLRILQQRVRPRRV
jgi:hypothetical protein